MEALKVLGTEKVGKIEFTGIEGGFGDGKKAMLVRDVAIAHNRPLFKLNQLIENNRSRFKDGIDIIDLLNTSEVFRNFAKENGLIGSNRTQHVYLLSERGYAKLLKIMDDDKAWDIYDELVDNYFNMLYKIAMATDSNSSKQQLLARAAKEITGEMTIPIMKEKEYSATDIAKKLGTTATMVGRTANRLGLKADQPGQNEYGRWANSKSRYSDKEVPQWLCTEAGYKAIKKEVKK